MRRGKRYISAVLLSISLSFCVGVTSSAAVTPEGGVYLMPISCAELLQDTTPFLSFFEAVAKGSVGTDRAFSRRLFRVLALREKLGEATGRTREANPVDTLIRRTLCFYREQKEPLKPITFDDAEFMKFLKNAVKDLETKVDDAVFEWEFERQQRAEYERRLKQNQGVVEKVQREADQEASRAFDRLSGAARRKVLTQ